MDHLQKRREPRSHAGAHFFISSRIAPRQIRNFFDCLSLFVPGGGTFLLAPVDRCCFVVVVVVVMIIAVETTMNHWDSMLLMPAVVGDAHGYLVRIVGRCVSRLLDHQQNNGMQMHGRMEFEGSSFVCPTVHVVASPLRVRARTAIAPQPSPPTKDEVDHYCHCSMIDWWICFKVTDSKSLYFPAKKKKNALGYTECLAMAAYLHEKDTKSFDSIDAKRTMDPEWNNGD